MVIEIIVMDQQKLDRLRQDVYALCVGFSEPASVQKIGSEYMETFDDSINFRQFGYSKLDDFLRDHPRMQRVFFGGKECYRCNLSDDSNLAEIQELVRGQKKKSKKRGKRGGFVGSRGSYGGNFNRNSSQFRSVRGTNFTGGSMFTTPRNFPQRSSVRGPSGSSPGLSRLNGRLSFNNNQPMRPDFAMSNGFNGPSTSSSSSDGSVSVGIERFLKVLNLCNGRAILDTINKRYLREYGVPFDHLELMRHFGSVKILQVINKYMSDEVSVVKGAQMIFISKKLIDVSRERMANVQVEIIKPAQRLLETPTLLELYNNLVDLLERLYPSTIPLCDIPTVYQRSYGVAVNSENDYRKSWAHLITITFKEKLTLTADETPAVSLQEKYIRKKRLDSQPPPQAAAQPVKKLTAKDLGIDESSDEDVSDSYDDPDDMKNDTESQSSVVVSESASIVNPCSTETEKDNREKTEDLPPARFSRAFKAKETVPVQPEFSKPNSVAGGGLLAKFGTKITSSVKDTMKDGWKKLKDGSKNKKDEEGSAKEEQQTSARSSVAPSIAVVNPRQRSLRNPIKVVSTDLLSDRHVTTSSTKPQTVLKAKEQEDDEQPMLIPGSIDPSVRVQEWVQTTEPKVGGFGFRGSGRKFRIRQEASTSKVDETIKGFPSTTEAYRQINTIPSIASETTLDSTSPAALSEQSSGSVLFQRRVASLCYTVEAMNISEAGTPKGSKAKLEQKENSSGDNVALGFERSSLTKKSHIPMVTKNRLFAQAMQQTK